MNTIAILTDFGLSDNFVGVMKGVILNINPRVNLVDITHNVEAGDIDVGAFLLKSSYKFFPKGTIFLAVVDPGVGTERRAVVIQSKNYIFVGPDNGLMSLAVYSDGIKNIVAIKNEKFFLKPVSCTFHGRDVFAPVAAHLSKGEKPYAFGRRINSIKMLDWPKPEVIKKNKTLEGKVVYIDKFGNLATNIDRTLFKGFISKEPFKITIKNRTITSISNSYQEVTRGRVLAIFGSHGFLEISANQGSAREILGVNKGTVVRVRGLAKVKRKYQSIYVD